MNQVSNVLAATTLAVIGFLVFGLIGTLPVFLIWNDLMPTLFGLKSISFWQAAQLSILCAFLFKSSSSSK